MLTHTIDAVAAICRGSMDARIWLHQARRRKDRTVPGHSTDILGSIHTFSAVNGTTLRANNRAAR